MVAGLPDSSALRRAENGAWHGWGIGEELTAQHVQWTQALYRLLFVGLRFEGKPPAPLQIRRPGETVEDKRPSRDDFRTALLGGG